MNMNKIFHFLSIFIIVLVIITSAPEGRRKSWR